MAKVPERADPSGAFLRLCQSGKNNGKIFHVSIAFGKKYGILIMYAETMFLLPCGMKFSDFGYAMPDNICER